MHPEPALQDFRHRYRAGLRPGYSGHRHAALVFGGGLTLAVLCFSRVSAGAGLLAWLLPPVCDRAMGTTLKR